MLAKIFSSTVVGLSAIPVTVEVDVADGLPGVTIVGLPDTTVRESKDRIKSALKNSQFAWPQSRITVNLAPADVRKEGSAFDFPIALGLLVASRQLEPSFFADSVVLGELALDGTLRPVPGVLPITLALTGGTKKLLLPAANAPEAAVVDGVAVYPIHHLNQAISFLKGTEKLEPLKLSLDKVFGSICPDEMDFSKVKGQQVAKRAIEVAVIFGVDIFHSVPPGRRR